MTKTEDFFPKANYTKSFWLSEEDNEPLSTHRTTPDLPEETDVLIIGSGYAGTSTAYYLYEQDPSLKISMFEARTVCSGATGRNGGHVKPYYHRYYHIYKALLGEQGVAEVVNSEYEHLFAIKKLVEDLEIDCDFFLTRACDVYPDREDTRVAADLQCAKDMLANPYVWPEVKKQLQIFHGEAARVISKNRETDIAFTYPAGSCWPWKLMTSIIKLLLGKGLNLQTNTCVTDVQKTSDGKWKVCTKDRGYTIAKKVVFCTNGYTKALLEEFDDVIVPQKGVACSIVPVDKEHIPHLTNTYGFFTSRPNSDYLINRPDGTVIAGGQDESMFVPFHGELSHYFDYTDDTFVEESSKAAFKNYMAKRFCTWETVETEVSKIWTGILGFTNDYMPYVGELDVIGRENCYIVAGFHGHGMPRVLFSGKAVATCITQNKKIHDTAGIVPKGYYISEKRLQSENVYRKALTKIAQTYATAS